ncbi:MAG: universal stress protein [Gammaproteobacteria bacterium]|nr:universal stress protein [Gammaproteobacteria bacterium]
MAALQLDNIFCVIDPTTNNQRALTRAVSVARNADATIHAHLCFAMPAGMHVNDMESFREAELTRQTLWLDAILQPHRDEGLKIESEVQCDDNWREALVNAAREVKAGLIVRSSYRHTTLQRRVLKTTDWTLLRQAHCPVLLVKSDRVGKSEKVLVALNVMDKSKAHEKLTDNVIDHARTIVDRSGSELFAVNAYHGRENFVHPPDLAKRVGIDRNKAYVGEGAPEDVIAEQLKNWRIAAGGDRLLARKGVSELVVGDTAERILDKINADVMVVMQR